MAKRVDHDKTVVLVLSKAEVRVLDNFLTPIYESISTDASQPLRIREALKRVVDVL